MAKFDLDTEILKVRSYFLIGTIPLSNNKAIAHSLGDLPYASAKQKRFFLLDKRLRELLSKKA